MTTESSQVRAPAPDLNLPEIAWLRQRDSPSR